MLTDKIMKRILIILTLILFSFGCRYAAPTEKHQKNRDRIVNIHDKIQEIDIGDLLVGSIAKVYVMDECFFIMDYKAYDDQLHVFDKAFKHVCSGIRKGRGPGEIIIPGEPIIDEAHRVFYVPDYGKQTIFCYKLDEFIADSTYIPASKMNLNTKQFPSKSQFISEDLLLGVIIEPIGNSSYKQSLAKWDMNNGEIIPMPYEHPDIERRRVDFAVSCQTGLYVEVYHHHDLMTICSLDGLLKYNIYGPKWDSRTSNAFIFYDKPLFCRDRIIVSYSGGKNDFDESYPTKLVLFDLEGNYIKTLETGYKISDFCYDEKSDRLILSLNDEIQFAYLDLDEIK